MLKLSQLNLYLALVALGTLRENIEDEAGAVNHPDLQMTLKVTLLRR